MAAQPSVSTDPASQLTSNLAGHVLPLAIIAFMNERRRMAGAAARSGFDGIQPELDGSPSCFDRETGFQTSGYRTVTANQRVQRSLPARFTSLHMESGVGEQGGGCIHGAGLTSSPTTIAARGET